MTRKNLLILMIIYGFLLLSAPGFSIALAQDLTVKTVSGIYANNNFVDTMTPNQALILYTVRPNGNITNASVITYNQVVGRSFDPSYYSLSRSFGRLHIDEDLGTQYVMGLIDDKYYYASSETTALSNVILPPLNTQLNNANLGTAKNRRIFIRMLNGLGFGVEPYDFRTMLSAWIWLGISIFLVIPFWFILKRFLR